MNTSSPTIELEAFADLKAAGLPGVLRDIAERISVEVAIRMARAFGGMDKYIPAQPPEGHPVCLAIGHDNAKKLGKLFVTAQVWTAP